MMDKTAATQYPILDVLRSRWSPLAFADRPVEIDKLHSVLEAARWAASSYNEQPWFFLIATKDNPIEYQRLLDCLVPGNQAWAKEAPVLFIAAAKLYFERSGDPNRHAWHDTGAALANLCIQATALGLHAHLMAGFDRDKVQQQYHLPERYEAVTAGALGYLGDINALPENLRKREEAPRTRRPLTDFVFTGDWGKTSSLVT